MLSLVQDSLEHCLSVVTCTSRRRLPIKVWYMFIFVLTMTTTMFMLVCVCTDRWEITTYDYHYLHNLTISSSPSHFSQCSYTDMTTVLNQGVLLTTYGHSGHPDGQTCQGDTQVQNISLVFPQYGSAFGLCLGIDDDLWTNISILCKPETPSRCLSYDTTSVKRPFCCVRCLYSEEEVEDMDDLGVTTFEPIFTVVGFLMVSLIVLCVCHILALIAFWKRVVPVIMITGMLFLVSGTFLAFCLAAHQYKVDMMNVRDKGQALPHMTREMMAASKTITGWSVDVGWMGFIFSVLTGMLWIRFSYYLAAETSASNKVSPTVTILHSNSIVATTRAESGSPRIPPPASPNAVSIPKSVRWASTSQPAGRDTSSTILPSSRPDSGSNLLPNEIPPATTSPNMNGGLLNSNKHPMMLEESV